MDQYSNIDPLLNSVEPWVMVSAVGENEYCTPLFVATKVEAAPLSTGSSISTDDPPEFGIPPRSPGWAVLVLTEDDWGTVVRPRLEAAKADLSRIEIICRERDGGGSPTFPRDIKLLYADPKPDIIVVDCWLDTVPSNLRVSDAQHARQALHPWKEVATRTDATVLLLGHTNRVQSPNARDRYGATYALRQKARMTLFAQQDQDGHLVVGPEKANGAPIKAASKFSITGVPFFQPNPRPPVRVSRRLTRQGSSGSGCHRGGRVDRAVRGLLVDQRGV